MFRRLLHIGHHAPGKQPLSKSVPDAKARLLLNSACLDVDVVARGKSLRTRSLATPAPWSNTLPLPESPVKYATFAARLPGALAASNSTANPPGKYETFSARLPGVLADDALLNNRAANAASQPPAAASEPPTAPPPDAGNFRPSPPSPYTPEGDSAWDFTAHD